MRVLKFVIAGLLLLALIFGVTPLFIGMNVLESTMANLVSFIPPESRGQVQITEESFSRDWFSSEAQWRVDYQPFGFEEPVSLDLLLDFEHGPLLNTEDGWRLGLISARISPQPVNAMSQELLSEIPFALPELRADLLVGLNQSVRLDLDISPIDFVDEGAELRFSGVSAELLVASDLAADFNLSMRELSINAPANGVGIRVAGFAIESHSEQINDLLAPAEATMALEEVSSNGLFVFNAQSMTAHSSIRPSTAGGPRIDFRQEISLPVVESELSLTSLQWSMAVNEVHSQLLRSYYELIAEMQSQVNAGSGLADGQVDELSQEMILLLLKNSLLLEIEFTASAYGGDHTLQLTLDWGGLPQLTDITQLDIGSAIAATGVDASAAFDFDAIMRSPAAATVAPYVQQGFIDVVNGQMILEATIRDGQLSVNGSEFPLNQLFGL